MPKLDGILETALYTDDMERAQAFYEDVLELQPIFSDSRLRAYGGGGPRRAADLQRGAATETVTMPGGTIPGHDGAGPLHVAFAIGKDELRAMGKASGVARRCDRRHDLLVARRPQHLLPRSGRTLLELATPGLWSVY